MEVHCRSMGERDRTDRHDRRCPKKNTRNDFESGPNGER